MSPIYVRPEREQAEHDRLIRFLQEKYSHRFEALANPGDERVAPLKVATVTHFPDLVLNEDKRLVGVVEVETAASVNNLETMAKWVPFSRARVPFHLYVPVQGYEAALRLADAHQVKAAEIWTYRPAMEGFDLVRMFADPALQEPRPSRAGAAKPAAPKPSAAAAAKPTAAKPTAPTAKTTASKRAKSDASPARPAKAASRPAKPVAKAAKKAAAKPVKAKPVAKAKPAAAKKRPAAKPARPQAAKAKSAKKGAGARRSR